MNQLAAALKKAAVVDRSCRACGVAIRFIEFKGRGGKVVIDAAPIISGSIELGDGRATWLEKEARDLAFYERRPLFAKHRCGAKGT